MSDLGFASFLKFVNSEFATENILFWLSVQRFKDEFERLTLPARQQHMNAIFSKYVATGAEFEINLSATLRESVSNDVNGILRGDQPPTANLFDKAQQEVVSLMRNGAFPRYQQSQLYHELKADFDLFQSNRKAKDTRK